MVSTFVADLGDLDDLEDDEEDRTSRLSFFEVPDFREAERQISDENYFSNRLRELTRITENKRSKSVDLTVKSELST